jgi:glycosyltransferase involved in cell wall biosynthesis
MSDKANKKCVLIDARFIPGSSGGVETVAMGLASGLSEINFDDIEIKFLVLKQHCEWIKHFIDSDLIFVQDSRNWFLKEVRDKMKFHRYRWSKKHFSQLPVCDKRIEELSPDLVHFVFQCGYKTASDFLYQPHDLQHLHYPEFFPPKVIRDRETKYRYLSNHSKYIVVGTQWIKNDVLDKYGVEDSKVKVVPLAPYSYPYGSEPADNAERHKIRFDKFIFYPAAPWPHKNHSLIFRSLCQLRDRGLIIPIVLSGPRSTGLDLSLLVQEFGIEDQVQDIGFVTDTELQHVYKSATALVMPSLFEAESLPVWEAFAAGTPVVCSNVTSMPDQIGDAGLLFNPLDASDLAEKLVNVWNDDRLQNELASRGALQMSRISWKESARRYLTLYRTSMLLPVSINELKTLNMPSEIG